MLFNELENSFEETENNTQEAGEVPAQKEENTGKIKEPKFDGSIHLAHNM